MPALDIETLCDLSNVQTREVVERLRSRFLEHYEQFKSDFDETDVSVNIIDSDRFLHRFLINQYGNEDTSYEKLKICFKWRNQTKIFYLTDQSFPAEFYQTGGIFQYPTDKEGLPMLYMRIRVVKKCTELDELMKMYIAYQIQKIDRQAGGLQSWAIVFDCSGMGFANVQLDMLKYLISTLREYYPVGVKYILVYEIPWLLTGVQRMVYSMLPDEAKKLIQFKNRSNITKLINSEHLPDYMDGGCTVNYRQVPKDCLTFREMHTGNYSVKDLDKIQAYFDGLKLELGLININNNNSEVAN